MTRTDDGANVLPIAGPIIIPVKGVERTVTSTNLNPQAIDADHVEVVQSDGTREPIGRAVRRVDRAVTALRNAIARLPSCDGVDAATARALARLVEDELAAVEAEARLRGKEPR